MTPGAVAGGDTEGWRIASEGFPRPARQWRHGPTKLRIMIMSFGVSVL
jgi:hypothetical protein